MVLPLFLFFLINETNWLENQSCYYFLLKYLEEARFPECWDLFFIICLIFLMFLLFLLN